MNPRSTGLLAVLAVALGVFIYYYEIGGEASRKSALSDAKNIFSGLSAEDVEAISLVTLDGIAARFERRQGAWFVATPVEARAEASALDAMAHALVAMPREGSAPAAGDLSRFGLGPDAKEVYFEISGVRRSLRIGGSTPVGGHRYVAGQSQDDPEGLSSREVSYVASYRVNAFNRKLSDLRDRRIFDFDEAAVSTLRIGWPEPRSGSMGATNEAPEWTEVALARAEDGMWHLGAPMRGMADQEIVRSVLSNLAYLRAEEFIDVPDQAAVESLSETALTVHWTLEAEHLEHHARIAGVIGDRQLVESENGRLALISSSRLDEFPRRIVDYRFRQLSDFDLSFARRVEMQFVDDGSPGTVGVSSGVGKLDATAELEEAGWRGRDSEGAEISPGQVSSLILEMSSLRADSVFAEEMGPSELTGLNLSPPLASIHVMGGSDPDAPAETLASLQIGRVYPGRGYFIMRGDSKAVYVIDSEGLGSLPVSAAAYREAFRRDSEADAAEAFDSGGEDAVDVDPLEDIEVP